MRKKFKEQLEFLGIQAALMVDSGKFNLQANTNKIKVDLKDRDRKDVKNPVQT